MDGSGFPLGLKGEEIQLEARIIAVADLAEIAFSGRPNAPARGLDVAREALVTQRGSHFDPQVVDACLALLEDGFTF